MTDPVHVDELATYLACPRQYEFTYVTELAGDERRTRDEFRRLLRTAITTGLDAALDSSADPRDTAVSALDSEWDAYRDSTEHHSAHQETTEKNRARAAIDAYFDTVGEEHLAGIERAADLCDIPIVGPDIELSATIDGYPLTVDVDYVMVDAGRVAGVRLTDSMWGSWVPWASSTDIVMEHFTQAEYRPRQVGTVFAARVAEEALNRFGGDGTGAELAYLGVMETTFETDDGCEAELELRWMGDYLEDARSDVDDALAWLCSNLGDELYSPEAVFDEQDHWNGSFELVLEHECRRCSYASGCQEAIRQDVMFNV